MQGALFVIHLINNVYLEKYQDLCVPLELGKVLRAEGFYLNKNKYSIIIETKPSNATFDATFLMHNLGALSIQNNFSIVGDVARINKYSQTSKCVNNYFAKNFCYCMVQK